MVDRSKWVKEDGWIDGWRRDRGQLNGWMFESMNDLILG